MSILDILKVLFFSLFSLSFVVWTVCVSVKKFREKNYFVCALTPMLFFLIALTICNYIAK